jgi:hypothetical protein
VWLGENEDSASIAVPLLKKIAPIALQLLKKMAASFEDDVVRIWEEEHLNVDDPELDTVGWVFSRSWFSRVWILQEISGARFSAVIMIGSFTLPYSELQECVGYFMSGIGGTPALKRLQSAAKKAHLVETITTDLSFFHILHISRDYF